MKYILIFENYINFTVNDNKYWFEVRDTYTENGYSIGWGSGDIDDDNYSKFGRTDRNEQFLIFKEVKKLFTEWFNKNKPDKFYFSVPGEKRMNIYINYLTQVIGSDYTYKIEETNYPPFDRREKKVYYVKFSKIKNNN